MTFVKSLEEAAAPFFLDRRGYRNVALGVVLSLVPVLFLFSFGYVLAFFRLAFRAEEHEQMPPWANWEELLHLGIVFLMVVLTYSAIPFLFTTAAFAMFGLGLVFLPPAVITLALGAVLWLVALAIIPLAFALFLQRGTVAAVFDLGEIQGRAFLILGLYVQTVLFSLAVLAAVFLPAFLNPHGYILSVPLVFVALAFLASLTGRVCAGAFRHP